MVIRLKDNLSRINQCAKSPDYTPETPDGGEDEDGYRFIF